MGKKNIFTQTGANSQQIQNQHNVHGDMVAGDKIQIEKQINIHGLDFSEVRRHRHIIVLSENSTVNTIFDDVEEYILFHSLCTDFLIVNKRKEYIYNRLKELNSSYPKLKKTEQEFTKYFDEDFVNENKYKLEELNMTQKQLIQYYTQCLKTITEDELIISIIIKKAKKHFIDTGKMIEKKYFYKKNLRKEILKYRILSFLKDIFETKKK